VTQINLERTEGAEVTDDIAALARYLNARNGAELAEMTAQMLKLSEEAGEVAAAWIGYLGQNPRKGVTHTLEDVFSELADVVITAKVAIARLGGDPDAEEARKAAVMAGRYEALNEEKRDA
jgi:NTP pyrophosphatase (non-canonical NTP hydrolase)